MSEGSFDGFLREAQAALFGSMPTHIARLGWDRSQVASMQRDRLRALLSIASERSPYHARRLAGIDPTTFELDDLRRLPIMTKAEMMERFDDVVTDRRVSLASAEHAISRTTDTPVPIDGELVVLASGGSSGRRGLFAFNAGEFSEFGCTLMRQAMARRQAAGGHGGGGGSGSEGGIEIAMVGAASAIHATGATPQMLDGSPVRFHRVPVTLPFEEIVRRLDDLRAPFLYGYPSMLARLAVARSRGELTCSPLIVTTTSETLRPDLRRVIADGFGAPIVNVFGSSEGLVGVSAPDDAVITFASDTCIVEPVDDDDLPVPPGVPSSAVLVTNLFNRTQPLIRYRIDDRFVVHPSLPGSGHLRAEVAGRASEVLRFGDVVVHPLIVASPLTRAAAVVDYQVRQTACGVDVDVVADGDVDTARLASEIEAGLGAAGVDRPQVHVKIVDAVARNEATGKLALFVPMAS